MDFYSSMAAMVADLLQPDKQGGLGQGAISIVRQVEGLPDPAAPWLPVGPSEMIDSVNQIGNPKAEYVAAGTVVRTDAAYMIVPPQLFAPETGDVVRIGGQDVGRIVHVESLGSLDVPVYYKIYVMK